MDRSKSQPRRVFISSTAYDLQAHRAVVDDTILRLQMYADDMARFGARSGTAIAESVSAVDKADIYVGIFAWRYGTIKTGETRSITHIEYDESVKLRIPRLIFLADPKTEALDNPLQLFPDNIRDHENDEKRRQFRQVLKEDQVVDYFTTPEDLGRRVAIALFLQILHNVPESLLMEQAQSAYLDALEEHYGYIDLPVVPKGMIALNQVYAPLRLLNDPVIASTLIGEERRALEDEPWQAPDDPRYQQPSKKYEDGRERISEVQRSHRIEVCNEQEALKKTPSGRLVILGGPGSGKTTLLHRLICFALRQLREGTGVQIPIFVSLADWARHGGTLAEYLREMMRDWEIDLRYADVLMDALKSKGTMLCLDSLDEVKADRRPEKIAWINRHAAIYGGTWVIGSRFTNYQGKQFYIGQFAEWEIKPMDEHMQVQLAQLLFPIFSCVVFGDQSVTVRSSVQFLRLLKEHPQIAMWGQNPLLFSLVAYLYVRQNRLPASRAEMYGQIVDAVIQRASGEQAEERRDETKRVLADLSLQLFQRHGRTFTLIDLRDILYEIHQSWHPGWDVPTIEQRIKACGLLSPVSAQAWGFSHQTFQEYFVALALSIGVMKSEYTTIYQPTIGILRDVRTHTRWNEPLRLLISILLHDRRVEGIRWVRHWLQELLILHQKDDDPGHLAFLLMLSILDEIPETMAPLFQVQMELAVQNWIDILVQTAQHQRWAMTQRVLGGLKSIQTLPKQISLLVADKLLALLEDTHENEYVRRAADQALSLLGDCIPVEPLVVDLSSQDSIVRGAAISVLSQLGDNIPIEPLIAVLPKSSEWERQIIVQALGKLKSRMPVELLIDTIFDSHVGGQEEAAQALSQLEEYKPIERLIIGLSDYDTNIRKAAVQALWHWGERAPIQSFITALSDYDAGVREATVQALGQLGEQAHIDLLIEALSDSSGRVRQAAVQALGQLGVRVSLQSFITALSDHDAGVREATVQALGQLGEQAHIDLLIEAFSDSSGRVRQAAIQALGQLGERAPIQSFIPALSDHNACVRAAAVQALGQLGEQKHIDLLIEALSDSSERVRQVVAQALGQLENRVTIEPLITALSDKDTDVRQAAAQALGQWGDQVPIGPLINFLSESHWQTRRAAVQLLSQLERMSIEPLIIVLSDYNAGVRAAAVQALGQLRDLVPIELFITAFSDHDAQVRATAIQALGQLRDQVPIELFITALTDSYVDEYGIAPVRAAAAQALGQLGSRVAIGPLLNALSDDDWVVQLAAAQALGQLGDFVPIQSLITALSGHDAHVRAGVTLALGQLGDPRALEPLISALSDQDVFVRGGAVQALGQLGDPRALEPLIVAHSDLDVQEIAAQAIEQLANELPAELLIAALSKKQWQMRKAVVQALGQLKCQHPIELLVAVFTNAEVATEQALGQLGNTRALEPLLEVLSESTIIEDAYVPVRVAAARALGQLGDLRALNSLIEVLTEKYEDARAAAAQALGQLGDSRALEPLFNILTESIIVEDVYVPVRVAAARALGQLRDPAAFESLVAALSDHHAYVREAAAQSLGQLGDPAAFESLVAVLSEGGVSAAAQALGQLGDPRALEPLIAALSEHDGNSVREAAAKALGQLGDPRALEPLIAALTDDFINIISTDQSETIHAPVRETAIHALGCLGDCVPIEPLIAAASDKFEFVRREAINIIKYRQPEVIEKMAANALALLSHQPYSGVLQSLNNSLSAEVIGAIGIDIDASFILLERYLDDPISWQVRRDAAVALGKIRKRVPKASKEKLLYLRKHDPWQVVREAADDALAEILAVDPIEE
jgi:HEAT repeat protein